ncbi:putative GEM-like protein 8 [Andrographis paniculata]|uniref:putative GEM-like protein 8 n=1 Tax=Andrographis paniculata TaxID=175694 RepID=UPI0021E971BE|nr:putative GEM-like protein 8 [Andrographis paniculata]
MEIKQSRSRIGKQSKSMHKEHLIGIPITSLEYAFAHKNSLKELLHDPSTQYQLHPSPSKHYSKIRYSSVDSILAKMIKLGQTMDIFAQGVREHMRLGPNLSETVKGKLSLGARIFQVGGVDKVFRHKFNTSDDEKLLRASQCYLSTTGGPIAGLLFVSDHRIAFCSERCIKLTAPTGKTLRAHYKVMIPIRKINRVCESENVAKPKQKYMQLVTEDNFDFWFMGFLNYKRTFKYIQQAIQQIR